MCLEAFDGLEIMKTYEEKNTLYILVNHVKISFFSYKYPKIEALQDTPYFSIYSIQDIAAMKLWAIQNRATNKDYVDLYYIIKTIGLNATLESFSRKFGNIVTDSHLLKSLTYFDDIEEEKLMLQDVNLDFNTIKTYLEDECSRYVT